MNFLTNCIFNYTNWENYSCNKQPLPIKRDIRIFNDSKSKPLTTAYSIAPVPIFK